jgi:hypothetical protein
LPTPSAVITSITAMALRFTSIAFLSEARMPETTMASPGVSAVLLVSAAAGAAAWVSCAMAGDDTTIAVVVASSAARKRDIFKPQSRPVIRARLLNPGTVLFTLCGRCLDPVCNQSKSSRRAICHLNETACLPKLVGVMLPGTCETMRKNR